MRFLSGSLWDVRKLLLFSASALFLCGPLLASEKKSLDPSLCFDFGTPVTLPLRKPLELPAQDDVTASGELKGEILWGAARGIVHKPIATILKGLLDPKIIKGPDNDGVKVTELTRPGYLKFLTIENSVRPVFFLSLSWKEDWAYTLLSGSASEPKSFLISYQKTEGTSHIERFCGSILVQNVSGSTAGDTNSTDVFLVEELKASRRTTEDIVNGHLGTLKSLRSL